MTRPSKVREADAVDELLANVAPDVVAAPDRYATATVDRYATAVADRYAAATPDRDAAKGPDRYTAAAVVLRSNRYATAEAPPKRLRQTQRIIVVMEPPSTFKGDMLYMPVGEYERAYDYEEPQWMDLWNRGDIVDFTEAAEIQWQSQYAYGNDGQTPMLLSANVFTDVTTTFHSNESIWGEMSSEYWPDCLELAQFIRERLAGDPGLVLDCLEAPSWAGTIAGTHTKDKRPDRVEVLAALKRSTTRGLGAAAIDLCVWEGSERIEEWPELEGLIQEIKKCDYVNELPVENFILDSADLHPGTHRSQNPWAVWYDLFGQYLAVGSEYYSDCCRTQPYGWRNSRLVPHGKPTLPDFEHVDMEVWHPKAFPDQAQGALFDDTEY